MRHTISSYKKKKWLALSLVSLALVALLIVAACGESATATPEPEEADARAHSHRHDGGRADEPSTGLRPLSEWTVDNPGTFAEIEAALENHRGESFSFATWGGAYQEMQRLAFFKPFSVTSSALTDYRRRPPGLRQGPRHGPHWQRNLGHRRWLRPGRCHHGSRRRPRRAGRVHHRQA